MFAKQHVFRSHTGRRKSSLNGKPGWVDAESNEISPEDENQSPTDPASTEPGCLCLSDRLYVNHQAFLVPSPAYKIECAILQRGGVLELGVLNSSSIDIHTRVHVPDIQNKNAMKQVNKLAI